MGDQISLKVRKGWKTRTVEGQRVVFCPAEFFSFDDNPDEQAALRRLADHLRQQPGLAFYGDGPLLDALLALEPALAAAAQALVLDTLPGDGALLPGLKRVAPSGLTDDIRTVFITAIDAVSRMAMRYRLPDSVAALDVMVLPELAADALPARAWTPITRNIYPIRLPDIRIEPGLDMLLFDCPARNLALMPNGLGYVHNALKQTSIRFQTFDLDIVTYHRFHMHRLYDKGGVVVLPSGRELPLDPWQAEHYDLWAAEDVIGYFLPIIEEAAAAIIAARPKVLGLSLHQCNEAFSRALVQRVKAALPETQILVGGFSCYNPEIGRSVFPESDYMCIGEADLTIGPLVEALARDERPKHMPGVLSRYDDPGHVYIPGPMPHNLDQIEFPKYEWFGIDIYRNYNDYQLTPIIASRGCRWSRCTFCAERFYWRIRSPENFVQELEWLVDQGCSLFMFNESDLNGMPEKVLDICDEIIRHGLHVKLTGQLRIHKKSDKAYFKKLREAGFVALRFGVDAFSANTMRLQRKGYTPAIASQNLRDCWEAGIYTEVNWVIGVPGETWDDVNEGIELLLANRDYIGRLANINPLILVNGSVYWLDPKSHNIEFREPPEELFAKYTRALPADKWYSTQPFIDHNVRKQYFEHVVVKLHEAGFPVGAWAQRIIEDVKLSRDKNRAGGAELVAADDVNRLLRATAAHRLYVHRGRYFAVPLGLGELSLDSDVAQAHPGILSAGTEAALVQLLDEAREWADSRGHYDPRHRQRRAGSDMRAGSLLGDEALPDLVEKPVVISYEAQWYAIPRAALEGSFDKLDRVVASNSAAAESHAESQPQVARSLPRRLVRALPSPIQNELRRLYTRYSTSVIGLQQAEGDSHLFRMVIKGAWEAYIKVPVACMTGKRVRRATTCIGDTGIEVVGAVTKGATPELNRTIENYNLVRFDGIYYGVPHGVPVDWSSGEASVHPGIFRGERAVDVIRQIEAHLGRRTRYLRSGAEFVAEVSKASSAKPKLVGTTEGYSIISFEGWYYGVPAKYSYIDLLEEDVMELPGVIRDVSRDVVESEILERASINAAAE
jgi:radical SAM superfamily enzyme YgiQ (UPF0313 family)